MRKNKGISAFLYRAPIYIENEIYIYTTGFDSMIHPFELENADYLLVLRNLELRLIRKEKEKNEMDKNNTREL